MELLSNVSRGMLRLPVPLVDRAPVFAAFHNLAHAGSQANWWLMTTRVMWCCLNTGHLVQRLPASQSLQGAHGGRQTHHNISVVVHSHTCGHSGSHASIDLQQEYYGYYCGQVLSLAGSLDYAGECRPNLCCYSHCQKDFQIWCACSANYKLREAVYIGHLCSPVQAA